LPTPYPRSIGSQHIPIRSARGHLEPGHLGSTIYIKLLRWIQRPESNVSGGEITIDQHIAGIRSVGDVELAGIGLIVSGLIADEDIADTNLVGVACERSHIRVLTAGGVQEACPTSDEGVVLSFGVKIASNGSYIRIYRTCCVVLTHLPAYESVIVAFVACAGCEAHKGSIVSGIIFSGPGTHEDIVCPSSGKHCFCTDLINRIDVDVPTDIQLSSGTLRPDAHVAILLNHEIRLPGAASILAGGRGEDIVRTGAVGEHNHLALVAIIAANADATIIDVILPTSTTPGSDFPNLIPSSSSPQSHSPVDV